MVDHLLKRSIFSFYAFGDHVSEKDFSAKNFVVTHDEHTACFCLSLVKDLDYSFFEKEKIYFDTYVFEESFIVTKIRSFLKANKHFQYFKFRIETDVIFELNLTMIKVQPKAIIFQSFQ